MRASGGIWPRRILQPTHARRRAGSAEGFSALNRRQSKCKPWYEDDRANGPRGKIVVQDKKVWSTIFENGSLHFRISGVDNFCAKGVRLHLQLKCCLTLRTNKVE